MSELPYRIVIGLEVHVQLLTHTKLFCGCSTRFGLPPNSATCSVCIGMPGVLPVMNRQAFELALKAALALNRRLASFTKWDRKNYYYPDLPKNYQISQYDLPFSEAGHLDIRTETGPKRIRIIRVHLEEDAGKMLHDEMGGGRDSLVDLNRAGTPLLEIVSEPDLSSPEEAKTYVEELRLLLKELAVSDCEMQEGSLRCDANVNLHVPHADGIVATPIIEIKNLNSFRGVERSLKYEIERQYHEYQTARDTSEADVLADPGPKDNPRKTVVKVRDAAGPEKPALYQLHRGYEGKLIPVSKATAGWDDGRGITTIQRYKEEAADYRYFPEPDLVPIVVDAAWQEQVRASLGELPAAQRERLRSQYALSEYDAEVIARQGRSFVAYYEEVARLSGDAKAACNWTTNQVLQTLNERKQAITEFTVSAPALADLLQRSRSVPLNNQLSREVYAHMLEHGVSAEQAIKDRRITVVDESQLREIVRRAIAANARAVADFKKGKTKAADAIKGAVMRETKGSARMELVQQLLLEELQQI